MVSVVYSCSSGKKRLPVSLGEAVSPRLLAATETHKDEVQVQGFSGDYHSFNGRYNGYLNGARCIHGGIQCWLNEKTQTVLYYDGSRFKLRQYPGKIVIAPKTKNGKLPLHGAWTVGQGKKMKITIKRVSMEGFDADGEQKGMNDVRAKETTLAIKHLSEETGSDFELDKAISSDGVKQSSDIEDLDEANGEVGSDVDQKRAPVMTDVAANHSADSLARDGLNGEISSNTDRNDDPDETSVDDSQSANSPEQAQDGKVGSDVKGGDANHSTDSPGQDLNGKVAEKGQQHGNGDSKDAGAYNMSTSGEEGQQNSGPEQSRSNHSGAQGTSTGEANMISSNSSGTEHSIPSAQGNVKGELESDAHEGNKSQPNSDGSKNSHDSPAHSNRAGIANSDGAYHMKHGSKNSSFDQTNTSIFSHADSLSTTEQDHLGINRTNSTDNLSTTEQDYLGGNRTNKALRETTEVVLISFNL